MNASADALSPGPDDGFGLPDHLRRRVRGWRHDLHRIPETAFAEHATSAYVARVLTQLGWDVTSGIGGTGVVGTFFRGTSYRTVGLRAELDALPIQEHSGLDYASGTDGAMHACGHDGHMAMLLGTAAALNERNDLDGTVRVIFQPAEEPGRGARAMVEDHLFDRFPVERLFGLHNLPGVPVGTLATRPGPVMACEDNFTIAITGRGGHASAPHLVIDPLVVAAEIVLALQTVVARSIDPISTAVVSCADLVTDGARNAIPTHVTISGDTRSFAPGVRELLEQRIRQISNGVATSHGATVAVTYTREFAPTVNDVDCTRLARDAGEQALGADRVDAAAAPNMASEDFGVLADQVPACFTFIGNGARPGTGSVPLHSHDYVFNDDALAAGMAFYLRVVEMSLRGA